MIICKALKESIDHGLKEAKKSLRLSNISHAVQSDVEANGFSVVREEQVISFDRFWSYSANRTICKSY